MIMEILQKTLNTLHELVISLALFFDSSIFMVYLILWFFFGITGAFVYKFLAGGQANLFGSEEAEREMFWFITCAGLLGFIASFVSWLDRLYAQKKRCTLTVLAPSIAEQKSKRDQSQTPSVIINIDHIRTLL
jgi:hypothetical protein